MMPAKFKPSTLHTRGKKPPAGRRKACLPPGTMKKTKAWRQIALKRLDLLEESNSALRRDSSKKGALMKQRGEKSKRLLFAIISARLSTIRQNEAEIKELKKILKK
ncbi:MAG: hypothetical protein WC308_02045 [archaeon]|jgi:hypothetical protein